MEKFISNIIIPNVKVNEKNILLKFNSHVDFLITTYKYTLSCDLKKQ